MKDFIRPRGRLRGLPLPARLIYSVFLVFTLVGLGFSAWLADEMVGLSLDGLAAYYAGIEPPAPSASPAAAGGPVLALPDDAMAPAPEPMSIHRLLEVTHFHLFSMPVYLMILAHLFALSRLGEGHKTLWISLASASTAIHIAAPWIARAASDWATLVYGGSGAGLALSYAVMACVPLLEMWLPAPSK